MSTFSIELEERIAKLERGTQKLARMTMGQRIELVLSCIDRLGAVAAPWVDAACRAKRIPDGDAARAEEWTTGPLATVRFLRLLAQTFREIQQAGQPDLNGRVSVEDDRCRVRIFPTSILFDSLLFRGITADTLLERSVDPRFVSHDAVARLTSSSEAGEVVVVLGAGNIAAIPATDALSKLLIENQAVLLKLSPVNAYLKPYFESSFAPLIAENLLCVCEGDAETGQAMMAHPAVDRIHVTGSIHTHDAIVWGSGADAQRRRHANQPLVAKPITSELGNVSPWAVVPGRYTLRELHFQAEMIAASITHNASFNCIATQVILTDRQWPQRDHFLCLLNDVLARTPRRYAYYPGSTQRFAKFSGRTPEDPDYPPWLVLRDAPIRSAPDRLREESFASVCCEVAITAGTGSEFLRQTTRLVEDQVWGTLAASLTIPQDFERRDAAVMRDCLRQWRYGTIGINIWPALAFAFMSPPWGAFPGSTLDDAQSGTGFVHNTSMLDKPLQTIIRAPLTLRPKPIWHTGHPHPERVARSLLGLYLNPGIWPLLRVAVHALGGPRKNLLPPQVPPQQVS